MKPDPPIAIDGQLGDWSKVPGGWDILGAEHVVAGASKWHGNDDLSGNVKLAWRRECLYLSADVSDDQIQVQHGADLWKGDYVGLYVDTTPDIDKDNTGFGPNQFNLGFSPGNFKHTGDILTDIGPEAYMFAPRIAECPDIQVASQRTEKGYTIEAMIPWKALGITNPEQGMKLGIQIMLSDCDSPQPIQEKVMVLNTPWTGSGNRGQLLKAVLAGTDGKGIESVDRIPIFDKIKLAPKEKKTFEFNVPQVPKGKDAIITFPARLDSPTAAGWAPMMQLSVNGTLLDGKRFVNKEASMDSNSGMSCSTTAGETFIVWYAPDYESADKSPNYGLKGARASLYELKVTDLLKPGKNTLVVDHPTPGGLSYDLYAGPGALEFRPIIKPKVKLGPPTGEIPMCVPSITPVKYNVEQTADGDISLSFGNNNYLIESQYSTPAPGWAKGSNKYFTVSREIEKKGECVVVKDTFVNLTNENLPLMHRHTVKMPGLKKTWLAGLSHESASAFSSSSENPTTFGTTDDCGLCLFPIDDVFRVHISNFYKDQTLGLADNTLVLTPGAKYTAEWAIVPEAKPDYYALVNTLRRFLGVNFQIDGTQAFISIHPDDTGKMDSQQLKDLVKNKSAKMLGSATVYPTYKTLDMTQGPYWRQVDHTFEKAEIARLKKILPDTKMVVYYHCFLDPLLEDAGRFKDDAMLQGDGKQVFYGGLPFTPLFIPSETNFWGREIGKNVDFAMDELGYQGIFWDEFETSQSSYHYGKPWDGVSADIDPQTMRISRLKSSIPLITQDWRVALAKKIMARGPLTGNGAPWTRTTTNLHFPRFTETGSISECTLTHLYTPIALGDHLTERSELDCYNWMLKALDYGCVYYWYSHTIHPTHPTLTSYMFPITPVELHEGYIIGKERIVTNRSGLFGWGDKSKHEVHVFNDKGIEDPSFKAPTVVKDGKTFTELRIGEGWSAAILKKL